MSPLKVAFVWHMHQPWYIWPGTSEAALPFVRLHAYGGYYDMPWLLGRLERTEVTINLVPALTEQLARYARGETTDRALELCRRDAVDLGPDDQHFLLANFSSAHPDAMSELSTRYARLLHKRGPSRNPDSLRMAREEFTTQDLRDLQVWLNLACCGYALTRESDIVRDLLVKDRGFTEEEKQALLEELHGAVGRVLPLYREAQEAGRAELTTSPFYHPILPLLCNMRDAMRRIRREDLPDELWHAPDEARRQVRQAREHHATLFEDTPAGMWPPEGSVSDTALRIIEESGFLWAASDEEVLAQSLGRHGRVAPDELYQPYTVGDGKLAVVFRDHVLSDRIGFVYRDWRPADAAADFIGRLRGIASQLQGLNRPGLVCVILDGENPWGSYPDGGEGFLRALYGGLERARDLEATSVGSYLEAYPPEHALASVFPGSWIDHSFRTWVGGREHTRAWNLLNGAVAAAERTESPEEARDARVPLMAAEGSDWFWWYSESHHDDQEAVFDQLFRANIAAAYRAVGQPGPSEMSEPIAVAGVGVLAEQPSGYMTATIDGKVTTYFEWQTAGLLRTSGLASAMHRSDALVREIRFGFSPDTLWLRVDTAGQAVGVLHDCRLEFHFPRRRAGELAVPAQEDGQDSAVTLAESLAGEARVAVGAIVEVAVPLSALEVTPGETLELALCATCAGQLVERWPQRGFLSLSVPTADDVSSSWLV